MGIEKNGTTYIVTDCGSFWKVENVSGKLSVCYKLSKADYPAFDDVRTFILTDDLF